MLHAPQVGDGAGAAVRQEGVKIHLMEHSLDIGQTDLEGGVDVPAAQHPVNLRGEPGRDQPLAVKAGDLHIRLLLHPSVFPGGVFCTIILHRNHGDKMLCAGSVVHHDDPMGTVDVHAVDARAAGQHQPIVSVQLGELAAVDVHAQHDALANRVI